MKTNNFSFKRVSNFERLLERLETELKIVKNLKLFKKEKVPKKWTRYEVILLKESII